MSESKQQFQDRGSHFKRTTRSNGSLRVALDCSKEKSMTHQSHKDECDINTILRNYQKTGDPTPFMSTRSPQWGIDAPTDVDFKSAMDTLALGNTMFAELPAHLRDKFHNDPAEYLAFCHNADNLDEMVQLGLAVRPEGSEPEPPSPDSSLNNPTKATEPSQAHSAPEGGTAME